ncbi:MAG: BON domain-containing protein [Acidobacteriota bacterium]|nr:BON domain-containing protein [Acidobacteriota bacterium]
MRFISLLLILVLIVPIFAMAQGTPSDDRIYDAVRRKLADDPDVKGAGFNVTVKNGAVTLLGRVHDAPAREKATRLVKKVKGVTGVDNKLKLFSDN